MLYTKMLSCEETSTVRALMTTWCSRECKTKLPPGVLWTARLTELFLDLFKVLRVLVIENRFSQRTLFAYFDGLLHFEFVSSSDHLVVELGTFRSVVIARDNFVSLFILFNLRLYCEDV